jgi:ADP-ribosylglycohydrolase
MLAEIRHRYRFDPTCQGTVPQAIIAFLESSSYEDAVRKAISLGGDTDTQACITGGIAQAYYRTIDDHIIKKVRVLLDERFLKVADLFVARYF